MASAELEKLISEAVKGDRKSISRLITMLERGDKQSFHYLVNNIKDSYTASYIVGFVGPPGAGKSTLLGKLVKKLLEKQGGKIGVLTVDPTSLLSGGSFMGNRIRMVEDLKGINQVYVRSFSAGHSLGGLTVGVYFASKLLTLAGYNTVFIEGVGAGHLDVKPLLYSHTRVAVLTPTSGDIIQMVKAGVMELCDLYIINRADEGNPFFVKSQLEETLRLRIHPDKWVPPVLTTIATAEKGVQEVAEAILQHKKYLEDSGEYCRRIKDMVVTELKDIFTTEVNEAFESFMEKNKTLIDKYL
ncbi:MAG: hypothetical protein QXG69_04705, partial [Candidatus Caldarchaeum sp.]